MFPYLIEYETTSEKAVLSYLCDAFEEDPKTQRNVMLFHRKLAPYKTGICLPKGKVISSNDKFKCLIKNQVNQSFPVFDKFCLVVF